MPRGISELAFLRVTLNTNVTLGYSAFFGPVQRVALKNFTQTVTPSACSTEDASCRPMIFHSSSYVQIQNSTFNHLYGRYMFRFVDHIVWENTQSTRTDNRSSSTACVDSEDSGHLNFESTQNVVIRNSTFLYSGAVHQCDDGETINPQGADQGFTTLRGTVSSATSTTLTASGVDFAAMDATHTQPIVAIVAGTGAGQWRRIVNRTTSTSTITIDRPFDIIPDTTSGYLAGFWDGKDWLIQGNTLKGNPRGIWFYSGGQDMAIVGNQLTNNGNIWLRAIQNDKRYQQFVAWDAVVAGNTVTNTQAVQEQNGWVAGIGISLQQPSGGPLVEYGLGDEFRRNTINTYQPNGAFEYINAGLPDGYWAFVDDEPLAGPPTQTTGAGILGALFDRNSASNTTTGYSYGGGDTQLIIACPIGVTTRKDVGSSSGIGSKGTVFFQPSGGCP